MKVICINGEIGRDYGFKLYGIYECRYKSEVLLENGYVVGFGTWSSVLRYFKPLDEFRENKINKILSE